MLINYTFSKLLKSGFVREMVELLSFNRQMLKTKSKIHKVFDNIYYKILFSFVSTNKISFWSRVKHFLRKLH